MPSVVATLISQAERIKPQESLQTFFLCPIFRFGKSDEDISCVIADVSALFSILSLTVQVSIGIFQKIC